MPNIAARPVVASTLSRIIVSVRSRVRPGPESPPMSRRFSRPSADHAGPGVGVGEAVAASLGSELKLGSGIT